MEPMAQTSFTITGVGMPFNIFTIGASALIRADGSPRYSMVCSMAGAILNVIVNPIVAFVLHWGIAGIAGTNVVGQVLTAGMALYYFVKKAKIVRLIKENLRPRLAFAKRICGLGLTPCINQLGITLLQIVMNNTMTHYGALSIYGSDIPLATVGAITKLNFIHAAFPTGIGQGCQPIQGYNYGAKNYDRVKKVLRLAIISASVVSVTVFALFHLFPRQIMTIFGDSDPLYLDFSSRYLRTFMFFIFLSGLQPIAATFFPAIGKPFRGLLVSLSRQVIFIIPALLILPRYLGLDGVLYAGPFSDFCAAVVSGTLIVTAVRNISAAQRALPERLE